MLRDADLVRLHHMLDAAREALSFCEGKKRADLDRDKMLARALVKAIEIVGEAASKVTPAARAEMPGVPSADIVTMRHRLIHTYFDIDLDIVWNTAAEDLPPLVDTLSQWLTRRDTM